MSDDILGEQQIGAPPKYRPEMDAVVESILSEGLSRECAAGQIGIEVTQFNEWRNPRHPCYHPSFASAVQRGVAAGRLWWERLGNKQAFGDNKGNVVSWIFNMKNRYNWADKHEVSGEVSFNSIVFGKDDDDDVVDGEQIESDAEVAKD